MRLPFFSGPTPPSPPRLTGAPRLQAGSWEGQKSFNVTVVLSGQAGFGLGSVFGVIELHICVKAFERHPAMTETPVVRAEPGVRHSMSFHAKTA